MYGLKHEKIYIKTQTIHAYLYIYIYMLSTDEIISFNFVKLYRDFKVNRFLIDNGE